MGKSFMVQGTASGVGKSFLVAGLIRSFARKGLRVVPFKAENMSLNSGVTAKGEEMARAQILQALGAGIEPDARMNPILLKPQGGEIQVVVLGKVWKMVPPFSLGAEISFLRDIVTEAFLSLSSQADLVVAEGMGSPAELNLRNRDLANMGFARRFHCPVILVGDIERGGVFASLYGTWALLHEDEKQLLAGFIINKLHGEKEILGPGIEKLRELTGVPVLGVLPYREFLLDDEDSLNLRTRPPRSGRGELRIGVVLLPHFSNTSDFQPLYLEPDVALSFVAPDGDLNIFDLLVLPGTKNTMQDLCTLHEVNFTERLRTFLSQGGTVLGICGGFQMLGGCVRDPWHLESSQDEIPGLSLLEMVTELHPQKVLRRVRGFWNGHPEARMEGYEIHQGRSHFLTSYPAFFLLDSVEQEGVAFGEQIFGTYCHGIFDQNHFRRHFLNFLRSKKNLPPLPEAGPSWREKLLQELDALADFLESHLDFQALEKILAL